MHRRQFFMGASLAGLGAALSHSHVLAGQASQPLRILLRSSWQTVNIGDIAHTPGILAILEQHLPQAEITLWPSNVDNGVKELLQARFPRLRLAQGEPAIKAAIAQCDFLLHGSGPSLVAERDVRRWHEETGKPFGVYGITLARKGSASTQAVDETAFQRTLDLLSRGQFVFFRDSVSRDLARDSGCTCPIMEFAPDAAFATDLRDDAQALAFLSAHGLEDQQFLCCIPRLRYTPYWTIPEKRAAFDTVKHARNQELGEHDHAPHRQAIIEVVTQTDLKVLVCPEDRTQMVVGKELLYDPLPQAIKSRVVWRPDYWLTGEAISTYVRSAGLFGNELHSPIMCIGHGVPAIVCRWAEQTSKGLMWRDIGLSEWLFDFDVEEDVQRLPATVLALARDPATAKTKAVQAQARVRQFQRETMAVLNSQVGA
jgi:polysaccharide pyruvyl transferase WcaK-like protein